MTPADGLDCTDELGHLGIGDGLALSELDEQLHLWCIQDSGGAAQGEERNGSCCDFLLVGCQASLYKSQGLIHCIVLLGAIHDDDGGDDGQGGGERAFDNRQETAREGRAQAT